MKDPDYAYRMGFDCGMTKPNETNCHFSLFATKELMEAWSRGKARAERERTTRMKTGTAAKIEAQDE